MSGHIKRSAIPASGYLYQTLVGIRVLCDWLDSPTLYSWIKFEADDEEDARGLDDIFVQRTDGQLGLTQVKFTVDPFDPNNLLSWEWLTARKGRRGKSLLEKWAGAAFRIGLDRLGDIRLVTNRRPDAAFAAHLDDARVQWDSLPESLRQEIERQLGGPNNATLFFSRFEFAHSYVGYESLTNAVSSALERQHTDHVGWLTLYRRAIEWSIQKNAPAPDGRITLDVLRSTISERQPRPLDQEFRIPAGYLPPDPQFARAFVTQAAAGSWNVRVLWGSPGQGKSTFLSHICVQLREMDVPVIRHHYFLDLQDPSDRFSLKSVARSLMSQMGSELPEAIAHLSDRPEELRAWIAACGHLCGTRGKQFVVVVDGLDHVWRENDQEVAPLNELFMQLLPVPEGVSLVLGTQRVAEQQLPRRLPRFLDPNDWTELPRMQLACTTAWLSAQHEAGTYQLPADDSGDTQLSALAEAFQKLSEGHPLVLTYTFMKLARQHRVLSPSLIAQADPIPYGDALIYYRALWQRLSWEARDALHLIAEDDFIWPIGALEECLGDPGLKLEAEIGHLLATVDAGLIPFHGSLHVFVAQQSDHSLRVEALRPRVEAWLAAQAPDYLRWGWLWLYESLRGEQYNLMTGTTRQWVLEGLVRAYEIPQIVRILEAAEEHAFVSGDYEMAIRKRSLKHRVDHALTYQLDDAGKVEDCALRLTVDPYPALLLASRANQINLPALQELAKLYLSLGHVERASEVQARMRTKINDRIHAGTMDSRDYDDAIERYLDVAAGTGDYDPERVLKLVRRHRTAVEIFERFLADASRAKDLARIMAFATLPMSARLRRALETQAIRCAGMAVAHLHEWSDFNRFRMHPLSTCWALLYAKGAVHRIPQIPSHPALTAATGSQDDAGLARYLHFAFFATVARGLPLQGATDGTGLGIETERKWLSAVLGRLASAAMNVAAVLARGDTPPVSLVYRLAAAERPKNYDHESWADVRAVRKALVLITADLFLLTRLRSGLLAIPATEWAACRESDVFALEHWREDYLMREYRLLSAEVVRAHIEGQASAIADTVGRFNEKAGELAALCEWATAYALVDVARDLLANTYRYAIGFGWRKDPGLARLLDAVEDVAARDSTAGVQAIGKLVPIYEQIDEMTEDSGARPSDLAALLLKLLPDAYVRYYRHWLSRGEWYHADNTFAAFVEYADLQSPEAAVALAFVSGKETLRALRERIRAPQGAAIPSLIRLCDAQDLSIDHDDQLTGVEQTGKVASAGDGLPMPSIQEFPPVQLTEFLAAVRAANDYTLKSKTIRSWFEYWEQQDCAMELLSACEQVANEDALLSDGNELLDLAFHLSYRIQGADKAFAWLIRAHQQRYGWSEHYYGHAESEKRLALVGQYYPQRWKEFLNRSTLPPTRYPERSRAIPDAGLVRLLLDVGDLARAKTVLEAMLDATLEEFESQPLIRPKWWEASSP